MRLLTAGSLVRAQQGEPEKSASDNRCAFSFVKRQRLCALIAARTSGVQQSKNGCTNKTARGGCSLRRSRSEPGGRCSEAEAGPETERCAVGRWPVVQHDNFRARNGRWFEPGRGSRIGQGCALFKTFGSGRNVSHTAPPALLFPTKSCGAGFRGGPSSAHRATGALFLFIGHKQSCTSALAKAAQAANIVTLQQVCDKVKRRRFAKRRRPPWNPRSKPNTSWPMP